MTSVVEQSVPDGGAIEQTSGSLASTKTIPSPNSNSDRRDSIFIFSQKESNHNICVHMRYNSYTLLYSITESLQFLSLSVQCSLCMYNKIIMICVYLCHLAWADQ